MKQRLCSVEKRVRGNVKEKQTRKRKKYKRELIRIQFKKHQAKHFFTETKYKLTSVRRPGCNEPVDSGCLEIRFVLFCNKENKIHNTLEFFVYLATLSRCIIITASQAAT